LRGWTGSHESECRGRRRTRVGAGFVNNCSDGFALDDTLIFWPRMKSRPVGLPSSRPLLSSLSAISSSIPRVVEGEYLVTESIRPERAFSSRSKRPSIYLSISRDRVCVKEKFKLESVALSLMQPYTGQRSSDLKVGQNTAISLDGTSSSVFTPQAKSRSFPSGKLAHPKTKILSDDEFDKQLNDDQGLYRPNSQDGFPSMAFSPNWRPHSPNPTLTN
jgi:hypothetical protein